MALICAWRPSSIGFRNYHLLHHQYQGEYEWDADLTGANEARLVSNVWWRKGLWLLIFPFIEGIVRPARLNKVDLFERWALLNSLITVGTAVLVTAFWGWGALGYLALSLFASIGLHPIGARWIQEHYVVKEGQETYSYYGPNNRLAMNVGYHNEHHDFMRVPWSQLPKLRKIAPEFYDNLFYHTSWTKVLRQFIFDPNFTFFSRIVRPDHEEKTSIKMTTRETDEICQDAMNPVQEKSAETPISPATSE